MLHRTIDPTDASRAAPADRRWLLLLLLIWAAASLWLLAASAHAIATMRLPDTDDTMRLLQVRDWLHGQGWFDLRQYRLDPPRGADIHWSRLIDLPLAGLILPLTQILGAQRAETVAAAVVPLLTLLAAMALVAAIARRTIAPSAWGWAPLMLLMAEPALGMMSPLRIDHHGWQIVGLLATVLGLIGKDRRRGGVIAGVSIAASLAIGLEMLPYLAIGAMLAVAAWVADAREGERLRWLALATAGGTITALMLFIPPGSRFALRCDALSIAYALPLVAGCAALFAASFVEARDWRARAGLAALAGVAAALPLFGTGTACLTDPYHAVDPQARVLWLNIVNEAQPLFAQPINIALQSLVFPMIGVAGALAMLARARRERLPMRPWLLIGAIGAGSILLSLIQTRAGVAAQALAVPGAAALCWLGRRRLAARPAMLVRVFGSVALFAGVSGLAPRLVIAAVFDTPETPGEIAADKANAACGDPAAMAALDALPAGIAFAGIDVTPALIAHTHHRGIAGPYHRNGAAIADVMQAWGGPVDAAHAILRRHRVDYVFMCGRPSEGLHYAQRAPAGFYATLERSVVSSPSPSGEGLGWGLSTSDAPGGEAPPPAPPLKGRGEEVPGWLVPQALAGTPWRAWRVLD